jgi:hypothetical protein
MRCAGERRQCGSELTKPSINPKLAAEMKRGFENARRLTLGVNIN